MATNCIGLCLRAIFHAVCFNGALAFCVCSLFFYDIKSKRISNRHNCDVYIRSECGSCTADVATAARPRTATHDYGRFYSYIIIIGDAASCRGLCTGRVFHPVQRPVERTPALHCNMTTETAYISELYRRKVLPSELTNTVLFAEAVSPIC